MASIDFGRGGCSTPNCSKSVNSFRPGIFFRYWHRLGLSITVAKSENEFVVPALTRTMGFVHEAENLENRKFHGKLKFRARSGFKIRLGSLARIALPCGAPRIITSDSQSGSP